MFVLAPGLPPGNGTEQSAGQVVDNTVLLGLSTPVTMAVLVYFTYAMIAFREREPAGTVIDGPPIHGNAKVQTWWLVITTTLVLFLAGYGTVRMLADGAGGGQGPNPIADTGRRPRARCRCRSSPSSGSSPTAGRATAASRRRRLVLPDQPHGGDPRHLTGRDPLVLGLPARRQGRRQPGL